MPRRSWQSAITAPTCSLGTWIVASIIGTFFVKTNDDKKIHAALFRGLIIASVALLGAAFGLVQILELGDVRDNWGHRAT